MMAEGTEDRGVLCLCSHRDKRKNKFKDANLRVFLLALDAVVQLSPLCFNAFQLRVRSLISGIIASVFWRS
jgi:hypothetical protein